MGKFTTIPQDTFAALQLDAGVLLKTFDPESAAISDEAIITATTGGISASCVPTYSDMGSDIDNCPENTKELKKLDSWLCTLGFTALAASADVIKMGLGAADTEENKITPRSDVVQADFADVWWVGDRADGGLVAIHLINALSTSGFSLQTTKNGKGQFAVELTGHVSITALDVVPMEFYVQEG